MTERHDSFHVKVCGLTRPDDVELDIVAGADLLGFNFVPSSPRCLDVQLAQALARVALGRARIVGVFADEDAESIRHIAANVPLDFIQLHGHESPEFVAALGTSAFKAVAIGSPADVEFARTYPGDLLLVDAQVRGQFGGTGMRIDPALVAPLARLRPLLLAGGLRPENVADAVHHVRPRGVDVASGVEKSPGIKDPDLMHRFVSEARRAAREILEEE